MLIIEIEKFELTGDHIVFMLFIEIEKKFPTAIFKLCY